MATLDEVARKYRWDEVHDYVRHHKEDGALVAIYGLGLYEEDAKAVVEALPTHRLREVRRVEHDHGTWLRVDVVPKEAD